MTTLMGVTKAMVEAQEAEKPVSLETIYDFVEVLTFSNAEEIMQMLSVVIAGEEFLALPAWARNLAYRLACLQEPHNPTILREAAADLRCFGPDWDEIAEDLARQADKIETDLRASG